MERRDESVAAVAVATAVEASTGGVVLEVDVYRSLPPAGMEELVRAVAGGMAVGDSVGRGWCASCS